MKITNNYQKHIEKPRKEARERYGNFSEEEEKEKYRERNQYSRECNKNL